MLVLASASKYRRAQLEQLGLSFDAEASGVDEDAEKALVVDPARLALTLARAKAEAVAARRPEGTVILGGDQLVAFDGEILGKPGDAAGALAQLGRMAGRTHELLTAICVVGPAGLETHLDRTELTLRALDEAALRRYVALDEPFDCAGSYKIERGGIALFERIRTEDPSAITGLPLMALSQILTRFGIHVP